jgi:hypothetical protein
MANSMTVNSNSEKKCRKSGSGSFQSEQNKLKTKVYPTKVGKMWTCLQRGSFIKGKNVMQTVLLCDASGGSTETLPFHHLTVVCSIINLFLISCKCTHKYRELTTEQRLQLFKKLYKQDHPIQGAFLLGLLDTGRVNHCWHGHMRHLLQAIARQQFGTQFQTVQAI